MEFCGAGLAFKFFNLPMCKKDKWLPFIETALGSLIVNIAGF